MIKEYILEELEEMDKEEVIDILLGLQEEYKELEHKYNNSEDYEPIYCDYDF